MTLKLKLLCRVVRRRVERGEDLSEVLKDYPRPDGGTESGDCQGVERSIKTDIKQERRISLFRRCAAVFERKS